MTGASKNLRDGRRRLCSVAGCPAEAPPNGSMCIQHWCLVPNSLKVVMRACFDPTATVQVEGWQKLARAATTLAQRASAAAASVPALRALTLIQPWGWAIVAGHKAVENRTWAPPSAMVGQPICIHGGRKYDDAAAEHIEAIIDQRLPAEAEAQGILGVAWISRAHDWEAKDADQDEALASRTVWDWRSDDRFGWLLRDVVAFPEPIPCRGMQGLWPVPADVAAKVWYRVHVAKALKT